MPPKPVIPKPGNAEVEGIRRSVFQSEGSCGIIRAVGSFFELVGRGVVMSETRLVDDARSESPHPGARPQLILQGIVRAPEYLKSRHVERFVGIRVTPVNRILTAQLIIDSRIVLIEIVDLFRRGEGIEGREACRVTVGGDVRNGRKRDRLLRYGAEARRGNLISLKRQPSCRIKHVHAVL